MANYTSQTAGFGQFDDPEQDQLNQQRQMARMLRQQAITPIEQQVVSGRVVPISWTQGLAKLLQGYAGRKDEELIKDAQSELNTKRSKEASDALAEFQKIYQGTPEKRTASLAPLVNNDPNNPQEIVTPAVPGDKAAAYASLLRGNNPMLAQLGMQGMASIPQMEERKQTREEQRDFQKEQLQAQIQAKKEAQQAQFENQRQLTNITAALRQPQSPVAVIGPNGKPMYVPPGSAYGMQPFNAASEARQVAHEQQKSQNEISAQQALDQAAMLYGHPGRQMATGASSWTSVIPGTEAKGFKANLDTFKAQTFIPMVSALKGMGALSDAEGKKLSESVGALDPSMPEKEFAQSLQRITNTLYQKAKASGLNVALPDFAAQSAGSMKPAQGANIDALLQKYGGR